jgi:type I restriction-modification system DNA methylase subunit
MPEMINEKFENLNNLIGNLWIEKNKNKALEIGLNIANEVIRIFGIPQQELDDYEQILNRAFSNAKFRNHKMESWFEKHPFFGSGRVALQHYDKGTYQVETKFYQFNDNFSKARVAATTKLEPNWEDSELTMIPEYKVGLDFFLDSKAKSLTLVVSKEDNLRVLELSEKLTNTQINIFNKLRNCFRLDGIEGKTKDELKFEPQRTIHQALWNALELKEVNKDFYVGIANLFEQLSSHLQNQASLKTTPNIEKQSKLFANRLIGRVLFLWFLNKKNFLSHKQDYFNLNTEEIEYYNKKLKVLFYEVLNTPVEERNNKKTNDFESVYLNGGLFEPHLNDWNDKQFNFPSNWFKDFYMHLNKFNFTTDESSPDYEQIAIDPEMLGRVFENLLASIVPETSETANERKNKGAFYTPREIVSLMCKEALKEHIKKYIDNEKDHLGVDKIIDMSDADFLEEKSTGSSLIWGNRSEEVRTLIIESINKIKVLDPACGSGAFPIGFMQIMLKTLERLSTVYDTNLKKHRPARTGEKFDIHLAKKSILKESLYGSDIEPMAIEISKIRAWLSLVVDKDEVTEPLPNLEFNFVCANSLVPLTKDYQQNIFEDHSNYHEETIRKLINKYFDSHGHKDKKKLRSDFNEIYNEMYSSEATNKRTKLLSTWNPFEFDKPAEFFDSKTMMNVDSFDVVIGNPPYIHFEDIKEISKNLYKPLKDLGFYKTYEPRGDIYTLFYEMGLANLNRGGVLSYITSNKWMRAGYGESLRNYLIEKTQPIFLIDLGSGVFDSATVDTAILVLSKINKNLETKAITLNSEIRKTNVSSYIKKNILKIKFKKGDLWIILAPIDLSIKQKIEKYGTPIKDMPNIKINRGILTGLNEAFIIDDKKRLEILKNCETETERIATEELIRPILRGKDIGTNSIKLSGLFVIYSYFEFHKQIEKFKSIKSHLFKYESELKMRGQARYNSSGSAANPLDKNYRGYPGQHHWLELDNNPSLDLLDDFNKQKIIFPAIMSKKPSFALDNKKYVVIAPGNVLIGENLDILIKYLNSVGYFALIKFYMGGGIEGELKINRLLDLPVPDLSKAKDEVDFYNILKFSKEEIDYFINFKQSLL